MIGMSKQSIGTSASEEGSSQSDWLFPIDREYAHCISALDRTGILTRLPKTRGGAVIFYEFWRQREYKISWDGSRINPKRDVADMSLNSNRSANNREKISFLEY